MALGRDVSVTWLGGATVLVRSPSGKSLLVDPLLESNPQCPPEQRSGEGVDALLVTHAAALADTLNLARTRSLPVVALADVARWLQRHGVSNVLPTNLGGSLDVLGVRVTTIRADHVTPADDGLSGASCGYVITFGNGYRIYHAGLTGLFGDMALVGEVYKPDLVLLAIGESDTLGPLEAAHAVRLLRARRVVPLVARGSLTRAFRAHLDELGLEKVNVVDLAPGQVLS
jgi:L-ascorbate metabolism protein UlaG (beta-lactamase superfamily)